MDDQADEHRLNIYVATTITLLWWIAYPVATAVYYLVVAVIFVLRSLYHPIGFLLQPVVYFGRFLLACFIAPFQLLAKFETVYIYLGVAALVGIAIGLVQAYLYSTLRGILRLDTKPKQQPPARSAKEYRQAKLEQQAKDEAPLITAGNLSRDGMSSSPLSPNHLSASDSSRRVKHSKGLLNQAIMEEMESDY